MARYVVLEFTDNKEADAFVAAARDKQLVHAVVSVEGAYTMESPQRDYGVVGYFMRPTLPCDCPPEAKGRQKGYSRGTKYGLWVHPACGKVNPVALNFWGHHLGLGRNLLSDNPLVEGLLRLDGSVSEGGTRLPGAKFQ